MINAFTFFLAILQFFFTNYDWFIIKVITQYKSIHMIFVAMDVAQFSQVDVQ